jgi:hypothetical protein
VLANESIINKPIYEKGLTNMKLHIRTTCTILKKNIYGKIEFRNFVDFRMGMTLLLVKFLDFLTLLTGFCEKSNITNILNNKFNAFLSNIE